MKRLVTALAALAVIGAGVGLASPASAAAVVNLSVKNGTVGVTQTIDAQVQTSGIGGEGTVTFTVAGTTIGTDTVGPTQGYDAEVYWTPSAAGRPNLTATFSGGGSDSTSVSIAKVGTTTSVTSPGSAAAGATIGLTAQVRAKVGSYVPTGNVTFYLTSGKSLGTSNVNGQAIASLNYELPSSTGNASFYAVYNGDSNADKSNPSATTTTRVSSQGSSVALVVPQTNYVNSSVTLTANITPNTGTGTVTFTVDKRTVGTAGVNKGSASVIWVPTSLGNPRVTATYSGGNNVTGSSDSKNVAVVQPLKADVITIDPVGAQGPILNNAVYVLANGASIQASISAISGLPVTIAVVGPCAWNGSAFSVQGVGGNCTVTATTSGGNGYAPSKLVFSISTSVGAQTANVSAPKSGAYKRGKTLTLAKAGTVTNLNKPIAWRVTKGGSYCKISKSKGAVFLKLVKKGKCSVNGSAPAVPGQWSAYSTARNYTVR
ncbi:MAG: Ig-like domain repeat protein [Candidatus Nanopelagicales bacterium]